MPIPYHPRRPKPLAVPTEEDVAAAIAPEAVNSAEAIAEAIGDRLAKFAAAPAGAQDPSPAQDDEE